MFSDMSFQLYQYLETLNETTRVLVLFAFFVGIPLLCILLYVLDKKIKEYKNKKGGKNGK